MRVETTNQLVMAAENCVIVIPQEVGYTCSSHLHTYLRNFLWLNACNVISWLRAHLLQLPWLVATPVLDQLRWLRQCDIGLVGLLFQSLPDMLWQDLVPQKSQLRWWTISCGATSGPNLQLISWCKFHRPLSRTTCASCDVLIRRCRSGYKTISLMIIPYLDPSLTITNQCYLWL